MVAKGLNGSLIDGRVSQVSLLPKLLLSTSIALTILFAATGWILRRQYDRADAGG
jgi:hypothetical protein